MLTDGRGRVLIAHAFLVRGLQLDTVEPVLNHLSNISKKYGGDEADKRALELMAFIEDENNSEQDILNFVKAEENKLLAVGNIQRR